MRTPASLIRTETSSYRIDMLVMLEGTLSTPEASTVVTGAGNCLLC